MRLCYPYRSAHPDAQWQDDIRLLASELPDREGLRGLVLENAFCMEPLMKNGAHGCCEKTENGELITVRFSFSCHIPDPSLPSPPALDERTKNISATLWSAVYRAVCRPRDSALPLLSDGLLCFGLLHGSGYYWSLEDHRERVRYGEHPKTFDELSSVRPSDAENALADLIFTYDAGEFDLIIKAYHH